MAILKNKKLTAARCVNLNKDICAYAGLISGDSVDVIAEDNGSVTIRKHSPKCRFCGDNVRVRKNIRRHFFDGNFKKQKADRSQMHKS